jgi:N-acyl-D-aspartate/D-glutamate deacylase
MEAEFDLVIRNGSIVDGSGRPGFRADVGIAGGIIRRIAPMIEPDLARHTIDAEDRVVSPGFIDTHTHDDLYLLTCPTCDDKVRQGVTTEVIGNCGQSVAPASAAHRDMLLDFLKIIGSAQVDRADLNAGSFEDYLRKLERAKPGINVLALVGHSTVRMSCMGMADRAPSDQELQDIRALVSQAMQAGAFGLSTGLIYAPGNYAATEEIVALARVLAPFGGIYATHLRSESDREIEAIAEAIRIGEEAGAHVHISHHKIGGRGNWGKSSETLRLMAQARSRGIGITCDQYPYRAGSTYLAAILPPRVLAGGPSVFSRNLKDEAFRRDLIRAVEDGTEPGWDNLLKGSGFEGILISVSRRRDYVGKTIAQIAEMECKNPYEVIFDLVAEENVGVIAILFGMCEEDIRRIMQDPWTMIGSDGIPGFGVNRVHPRMTGTFPRVLGKYVREEAILSLEAAVRKMTSLPAETFGLKRKGLLQEGFDADLVVFDPRTIIDRSTFEEPNRGPDGIDHVFVNGRPAVEKGRILGATSGQVLRREA